MEGDQPDLAVDNIFEAALYHQSWETKQTQPLIGQLRK